MLRYRARLHEPTDEDREWMSDIAGKWRCVRHVAEIWANYRATSFISQYLSPRVIREFWFVQCPRRWRNEMNVAAIHDDGVMGKSVARSRSTTISPTAIRKFRSSTSILLAIASSSCSTACSMGWCSRRVIPIRCFSTSLDLWGYDVKLVEVRRQRHEVKCRTQSAPVPPFLKQMQDGGVELHGREDCDLPVAGDCLLSARDDPRTSQLPRGLPGGGRKATRKLPRSFALRVGGPFRFGQIHSIHQTIPLSLIHSICHSIPFIPSLRPDHSISISFHYLSISSFLHPFHSISIHSFPPP